MRGATIKKDWIKYLGGFLLAILLFWLVLRGTDPATVWQQLGRASITGLLLCSLINLAHNVPRVWRWGALLRPVRPGLPFRSMFSAVILGYMVTWLIPLRLGELVRPALLSGRENVPLGPTLGSVIVDRLLDGVTVVAMFGIGIIVTPLSGQAAEHAAVIRGTAITLTVIVILAVVVLVGASAIRERLEPWLDRRGRFISWFGRTVLSFARGADALKSPRLLAEVLFQSALAWGMIALATWIGMRACGADVPFGATLILMPLLTLGIALPTPGGAGGYHAAMTFGLHQLFGVEETVAVTTSLLMHLTVVIPTVLLGSALLVVDRIPFRDLVDAARQIKELGADADIGREGPAEAAP